MIRYLYDMLSFVSLILLFYLLIRFSLVKKVKFNLIKDTLRIAFVIYIAALIFIVLIKGRIPTDYLLYNFIPFHTIIEYLSVGSPASAFKNIIGNIIITMPLGFFAYVNIRIFTVMHILIYSVCISFSIEFVQFLTYLSGFGTRSIDIDDIILNSLGIIMGYVLTKMFKKVISHKINISSINADEKSAPKIFDAS